MPQRKELCLVFSLFFLAIPCTAIGLSPIKASVDSVRNGITQEESNLFAMINDMRRQNRLPAIPLSSDLCKVARIHIADLLKNRPQDKGCSLHSWSGNGRWTSCCSTKDEFGLECMKSKPREITGYNGDGYELIYWSEGNATASEAAALWKQVGGSSEMILCQAAWSRYHWGAAGVGIKGGYAILWLGDSTVVDDNEAFAVKISSGQKPVPKSITEAKLPANEKKSSVQTTTALKETPNNKLPANETVKNYYLIIGSFKTAEGADAELKTIRSKGYPYTFILEEESLFRIAFAVYNSKEIADQRKNELKDVFPGIWIYQKQVK